MKTISGFVSASGAVTAGNGFTVGKWMDGTYLLQFPVGSWPSTPAVAVTPFGRPGFLPIAVVDSVARHSDGSASALVVTTNVADGSQTDTAFVFVAAAT